MLVVQVKEGEAIDRALKRYKRKFDRKQFIKPSVRRRKEVIKAAYIQQKSISED
jgi:small subunit ribosomal protein S21